MDSQIWHGAKDCCDVQVLRLFSDKARLILGEISASGIFFCLLVLAMHAIVNILLFHESRWLNTKKYIVVVLFVAVAA